MTAVIDIAARPRLVTKAMLRYDPVRESNLLLLPERVVRLNESSAAILARCDGSRTVKELIEALEQEYGTDGLAADVTAFLNAAREHGWVQA